MKSKEHPKRQVNNSLLNSNRVLSINRILKKIHTATDSLYENMMEKERGYIISYATKIQKFCEEIKNNPDKFIKDDE